MDYKERKQEERERKQMEYMGLFGIGPYAGEKKTVLTSLLHVILWFWVMCIILGFLCCSVNIVAKIVTGHTSEEVQAQAQLQYAGMQGSPEDLCYALQYTGIYERENNPSEVTKKRAEKMLRKLYVEGFMLEELNAIKLVVQMELSEKDKLTCYTGALKKTCGEYTLRAGKPVIVHTVHGCPVETPLGKPLDGVELGTLIYGVTWTYVNEYTRVERDYVYLGGKYIDIISV